MSHFNVGIFIDKNVTDDWGGSYYYQETLLAELAKRNGQFGFVFKIVTNNPSYSNDLLEVLVLPEPIPLKSDSFIGRIVKKGTHKVFPALNLPDEFLKQKNVHLLYYIQQHLGLTNTFPFIINNWDMAHITAAGFPDTLDSFDLRRRWVDEYFTKSLAIISESQTGKTEIIRYTAVSEDKVFVAPMFPSRLVSLHLSESRIDTIINGLNLNSFGFLFFPAQFWALKNHYNLLQGLSIAISKGIDNCSLVLTGSEKGNFVYVQKLIREMGLEDHVIMTGFLKEEEIHALYKRARALIFPTLLGPTNMPLLEALALSCPILCSNLKGHMEILGDYNGFFDPLNPNEIAENIIKVCMDDHFRNSLISYLQSLQKTNNFNLINNVDCIFKMLEVVRNKRLCWQ